jgi:hypothetical protein
MEASGTRPPDERRLTIDGDGQGDPDAHGGVFVYQIESYRYWQELLGRDDFCYGQFGENFTVQGLAPIRTALAIATASARRCSKVPSPGPPRHGRRGWHQRPGGGHDGLLDGRLLVRAGCPAPRLGGPPGSRRFGLVALAEVLAEEGVDGGGDGVSFFLQGEVARTSPMQPVPRSKPNSMPGPGDDVDPLPVSPFEHKRVFWNSGQRQVRPGGRVSLTSTSNLTPGGMMTTFHTVDIDGLNIFWREAGDPGSPKLLLPGLLAPVPPAHPGPGRTVPRDVTRLPRIRQHRPA